MKKKIFNLNTLNYVFILLIALLVGILGGVADIIQTKSVVAMSEHLGYPLYFFTLLGIFKVLGGIILLLPRRYDKVKDFAYGGFAFDFIFASFSHFSVGDPIIKVIVPLIFLLILYFSYVIKNKALISN